jgi:AraC-like DNA-binding protein
MPSKPPRTAAVPTLRFSTDAFPERERVAAWREIFGRTVVNVDIQPLNPDRFRAQATVCALPGLGILFACNGAQRATLPREMIKHDDVSFMAAPTCQWTASQLGRNLELGPGDGVLMSNADVGSLTLASQCRFTTFCVPSAAIAPLVPDLGAAFARRIPAGNAALKLLASYLACVRDAEALVEPELQQIAVGHVYDLLAVALGATRDAMEIAARRGVRAARLSAAKALVMRQLSRHDLSVVTVAAHLGVTPRYVQMLFETEDLSLSGFILVQRLLFARRMLMDPRCIDSPISAIAFDAGFGDLSYFNRTFRRRFGCTPSEVRAQVRRDGASD